MSILPSPPTYCGRLDARDVQRKGAPLPLDDTLIALIDAVSVCVGGETWDTNRGRIWQLSQRWDYSRANDAAVLEDDPWRDRVVPLLERVKLREPWFADALSLAECGSVWCMGLVGWAYHRGEAGASPDRAKAIAWYRRAAEGGATRFLLDYVSAVGKSADGPQLAVHALQPHAADGWAPALFWLAWYQMKLNPSASTNRNVRPLLERASALGSPLAQFILARHMSSGSYGFWLIPQGARLMCAFVKRTSPAILDGKPFEDVRPPAWDRRSRS